MDFGTRLRNLREAAGLTQAELADGISAASYISLLEAGKRKPKPELVDQFASRLGVSVAELIIDQGDQEVDWSLNVAQVALSSGNLDDAENYARQIIDSSRDHNGARLAAAVVLIQVRVRQGKVEGVLDELERLFNDHLQAAPELRVRIGNEIVRVCFRSGDFGMGAQRGEEMLREFATAWPETEVVELLCLVASCHFHRGDTHRASELVTQALELAEACKSPKAMVQSQWQSSMLAESRGDLSLALHHITNALHWSKVAELNDVVPALNNNAARILLELPNPDLDQIHNLAEVAYIHFTSQNHSVPAAYACLTLSEVELLRGNPSNALMFVRKGLTELPKDVPGPRARLLCLEAKVLFKLGMVEESQIQLELALQHAVDMEPSKEVAVYWGEVARVFVEMGLQERAIDAYEKALSATAAASQEESKTLLGSKV
jgi:transcriptional regulator with XRE-family HTH domain